VSYGLRTATVRALVAFDVDRVAPREVDLESRRAVGSLRVIRLRLPWQTLARRHVPCPSLRCSLKRLDQTALNIVVDGQ
jgi:hypothetical protein